MDVEQNSANTHSVIAHNWRQEARALLVLGLPMAATQFVSYFIYTIDILMISRISAEDVAAAGLALVVNFLLWMVGSGPVMAVTPLVAQALGKENPDYTDIRHSVRMALWLIVALLPILAIVIYFMVPIATLLGQDIDIAINAQRYMAVLAIGWPFMLMIMALRNFLATLNKTTVPFLLIIFTTALNALFNYILIFGKFGAPRLELIGAGIASTLATIITFAVFIAYINWDKSARQFDLFKNWYKPDWVRFKQVVKLGWPISIANIFEGMLFNAGLLLMGVIAVRIGHAAGANDLVRAKRAAWVCVMLAAVMMSAMAIFIALFPDVIATLYVGSDDENKNVKLFVMGFLPLAAGFMFFDAIQVAANQLLRGLKDVRIPMVITGISFWGVGFSVSYYLALKTEVGANGVWHGLTAGLITASVLLGGRLYYLLWQKQWLGQENS